VSSLAYEEQSAVAQLFAEFAGAGLPLNHHSPALQNALIVTTGSAYLTSITITNTNAAAQFVQLHDAVAVPADGAVPVVTFTAAASSDKFVTYSLPGRYFLTGIVVCNSSTAATKTIGAADCFFDVQHIPVVR
jgi:hypothetical protein